MRLTVAAIGRLRGGPELELTNDYSTRIRAAGRPLGFSSFDVREFEAPKGLTGTKRQERESALLEQAAPPPAKRILLDERGKNLSSEAFARQIARWRDDGAGDAVFMIGGADGHDQALAGKATFPHMLVRTMLVEQIYRAMTILAGHPYHRG